jgi:hypothetical protein
MRSRLRRARVPFVVAAALFVAATAAALAVAQDTSPIRVTADAKVIPNKAGTPAHPQGVRIDVHAHITVPDAYEPPLVSAVDVWFPRGGVYNGARFPSCSENTLAREGLAGCPAGSIMGHGTGKATADTVFTYPKITVVNGGGSNVYFYTVMNNPARVQAPVPGTITRLSGKWSYKLHTTIPRVLQIVAGIPIILRELHVSAGRRDWIATTSCPASRAWPYHVLVTFNTGETTTYDGTVACRS